MSMFPVYLNIALGAVVFVCAALAAHVYQDEYDWGDRLILAGIAGSMIIVTPAVLDHASPFPWAYNLSRAFFAAFFLKRFGVPVIWKWRARKREDLQKAQSGTRLADRMRHKL